MDWPKIKTILIGVLLVTNILLGVTFYQSHMRFRSDQKEQLERVLELMAKKDVHLYGVSLDFPTYLNSIDVAYEKNREAIIEKLLGSDYEVSGNQYMRGRATVTLSEIALYYEKKPISTKVYDNTLPSEDVVDVSELEIIHDATKGFLSDLSLEEDYVFERTYIRNGYTVVTARQVYKDYVMEDALMIIVLDEDEVVGFRRIWLDINSDLSGNKYDIISVDRALYVTLPDLSEGDVISDVSISYKLNDSSSVVSNLISGEALPFYRIETQAGNTYYVRAIIEQ